jgi:anaerobic selenocysteine-containing dehydrogenase
VSSADLHEARTLIGDGAGVVFVLGRPNLAEHADVVTLSALHLAKAFPNATFLPAVRRGNTRGALDMGLHPRLRAGRQVASQAEGRDALAQLRAAAEGTQATIVLLGGGLFGNVADSPLATAALERATVIAVSGHGSPEWAYADVVLPATVGYERFGTVTNLEGRVSALAPKIVPPGAAWPDVAIAAELAEEFGVALGLSTPEDTATTVQASTGYPLATVLAHGATDGVVVGRDLMPSTPTPFDPMAFPGVRSAELVGPAERAGSVASALATSGELSPSSLAEVPWNTEVTVPAPDAYSFRLVVTKTLYDLGAAMRATAALSGVVASTVLHVHPGDADRMGAADGDLVRLSGPRGAFELPVLRVAGVAKGTVVLASATLTANGHDVAGTLTQSDATVVEVRWESR